MLLLWVLLTIESSFGVNLTRTEFTTEFTCLVFAFTFKPITCVCNTYDNPLIHFLATTTSAVTVIKKIGFSNPFDLQLVSSRHLMRQKIDNHIKGKITPIVAKYIGGLIAVVCRLELVAKFSHLIGVIMRLY